MSYISLYRKYRPKQFSDVVGQDIVVKILKNSIINNKISHAYIFSGPRGTGKTSIAKIFAKAVNCLSPIDGDVCCKCSICENIDNEIDIIEIDAASNNGVDEIREITNNVKLIPSVLKYRVYIIDEVHMLSASAFNALLKTLEEPPSYVIFILATTEINKIPATVISRCQKFDFKKISDINIFNRLKYILKNENKELEDDIINLIVELSNGGLRDAINLLDQVLSINSKKITRTDVLNIVGEIDENILIQFLNDIVLNNIENVISSINTFYENGINFIKLVDKIESIVKDILIFNSTNNYFSKEYENKLIMFSKIDINRIADLSKELFNLSYELKRNTNHKLVCEIYFVKMSLIFQNTNIDNKQNQIINNEEQINNSKIDKDSEGDLLLQDNKNILINNCLYGANKELKNAFISKFDQINEFLTNKTFNSISNLLLKSKAEVVSDKIILFTFKNNFEVLLFNQNSVEVKKLLKKIYNKNYDVVSVTNEEWENIKKEYIKNIKNGVEYKYINQKSSQLNNKNYSKLESNVENVFGDDYKIID